MAMRTINPPSGPRAGRNRGSSRLSNQGGIQKRGQQTTHADKDGDVDMDAALPGRGRGRALDNRRNNHRGTTHGTITHGHLPSRDTRTSRVDPSSVHKAILRTMGSKDAAPRGTRVTSRLARQVGKSIGEKKESAPGGLDQLVIHGLKQSKAASNPGGGVKELLEFLERKSTPNAPSGEAVRIRKVCLTSQSAGSQSRRSLALSGPLSFHAKLSKRRPRYTSHATSDSGGTCNFKVICLANVV